MNIMKLISSLMMMGYARWRAERAMADTITTQLSSAGHDILLSVQWTYYEAKLDVSFAIHYLF